MTNLFNYINNKQFDEEKFFNPFIKESQNKIPDPCVLIIFGATGDLTSRKLIPAIYNLAKMGLLPTNFVCVGFARRNKTHEEFRSQLKTTAQNFISDFNEKIWESLSIYYFQSDFNDHKGYKDLIPFLQKIDEKHHTEGNRLFYLSTPPNDFSQIINNLNQHNLIYNSQNTFPWSRLIIEKPFGKDLASALSLQKCIANALDESQVYRIDHYLGKETVQNILSLRFSNPIFEAFWNNQYIDHVQISMSESIGIGTRGNFFEEAGMLRDVVQNHLLQLLCLLAMEPPSSLEANTIRDEKVKVLKSLRSFNLRQLDSSIVRGQYTEGYINGIKVKGYKQEDNTSSNSLVETFVALKLYIDNWRWSKVPFYLRAGKRLPKRCTDVAIVFKAPPKVLFSSEQFASSDSNILVIRIQPNEGIALKFNCKVPGTHNLIRPVKMDFDYNSYFDIAGATAYEKLICDAILGDSTLFTRDDEVLTSWALFSPVLHRWQEHSDSLKVHPYPAGSTGPEAADNLIQGDKRQWRLL